MHARRTAARSVVLVALTMSTSTGCALFGGDETPQAADAPSSGATAILAEPSSDSTAVVAVPSGVPTQDSGDDAAAFAERYGAQVQEAAEEAQVVAEDVAARYVTWSWQEDKTAESWLARMEGLVTEGFLHDTEELLEGDSWRALVLQGQVAQRGIVDSIGLDTATPPTLFAATFNVSLTLEQAIGDDDYEPLQALDFLVTVQRESVDLPWQVTLIAAPTQG